jgi:hypothetical protein
VTFPIGLVNRKPGLRLQLASVTQGPLFQDFVSKFLNVSVMPRGTRPSSLRRYKLFETLLRGPLAMRPCDRCIANSLECRVDYSVSEKCAQCVRSSHTCSLTVGDTEWDNLHGSLDKIEREIQCAKESKQEIRARLLRLKRQKQALLDKRKKMFDRESQNVAELEVDEFVRANLQNPSSVGRDSPQTPTGLSQVSFSALLNRNTPELQSSS